MKTVAPLLEMRSIVKRCPEHEYVAPWWPPGHLLGHEHGFTQVERSATDGSGWTEDLGPTAIPRQPAAPAVTWPVG
jgi:hypothetical protein